MRILTSSVLLLVAALATPASAPSVLGEWRATAAVPDGQVSETISVQKVAEGYVITVSDTQPPSPPGISAGSGIDIKLEGDTFPYKHIASTPDGEIEIVYTGDVNGDSFTGTGEIMGFGVPLTVSA